MALTQSSSTDAALKQEQVLNLAKSAQAEFEQANLHLRANTNTFHTTRLDLDDVDEQDLKDPAIVAGNVADQTSYLRKLKFQYLEQNAKDKYIKSIVSDIENAPIVTTDDNTKLQETNLQQKEQLKLAKQQLAEVHGNIRTLAPMVEEDYQRLSATTARASELAQKIIDARLALTRLRQTHPHPRLTVTAANQKLDDQINEIQVLHEETSNVESNLRSVKSRITAEKHVVEKLRMERAEVEKTVRNAKLDEDDARLVPLYEWYTAALSFHRSLLDLEESHSETANKLQLTYNLDSAPNAPRRQVTISLTFAPDTRRLFEVQVEGLEDLAVDFNDIIETYMRVDDVAALIATVLQKARAVCKAGS
ncbi:hypothetical protein BDN72DRAFT_898210 [Pluteus cervinus]|uniref:Uncharacterized protein n=1 Tax=Pluteus cervinus TaxID=181527 RepID=A0ACD3ATU3_9AGAR|nr:hypothetical protein BDN72DRAFT_898210 [Pluteus cervinus]